MAPLAERFNEVAVLPLKWDELAVQLDRVWRSEAHLRRAPAILLGPENHFPLFQDCTSLPGVQLQPLRKAGIGAGGGCNGGNGLGPGPKENRADIFRFDDVPGAGQEHSRILHLTQVPEKQIGVVDGLVHEYPATLRLA